MIYKPPKKKTVKNAEQATEELKLLRQKSEVNDKTIFEAAVITFVFGVLFFFVCFVAKVPLNPSAHSEAFKTVVFKAVTNLATAFGFVLFGVFLISKLIVKLVYHIKERKLNNGIIAENGNNRNCTRG